ncbi:FAD:protein FMN transferase [Sphingobacterium griseoflavum]|uniref:FAD:protein FMN transferase n=2 Tax=Sphingobacterium griseoflavum TaxID=1474952 RepID=A0ABQ3HVX6_9SPHI|nr:FAD:protein FMN transferase [Sphingobacterium griseoflavum]
MCVAFLCLIWPAKLSAQVTVKRVLTLMGSRFEVTVVERDSMSAAKCIDTVAAEITRIENLISEWRPHTQVSEVNRQAGIKPVRVDRELFSLTQRALQFSRLSGGAFDISIAAMDRLWRFDDSMTELPAAAAIRQSVAKVNYKNIILDSVASTIYLAEKGMKIGFGSIGKGYAADCGRTLLKSMGVKGGIVNASGDLSTWGTQIDEQPWRVGIKNPRKGNKMIAILKMREASVATSGSYEKYVEFNGKRYAHIINPKTGYPASGFISVTVYGPSAEFANGLSTSMMVLGARDGEKLLRQFPAYKAVWMTDTGRIKHFR